jgi:hypothetical protein
MKETGDMTTAVAEIIQERMEAAGGYVETAADRAAQAQVRLDNAMTELGNTMNSLSGTGATLWTDLKAGAVDLANTAIKPLISLFNQLASYINGSSAEDILTRGMTDVTDTVDDNGRLIRKNAINKIPEISVTGTAPKKTRRSGGGRSGGFNISSIAFDQNKAMLSGVKAEDMMPSVYDMVKPESILGHADEWEKYKDTITGSIGSIGDSMSNLTQWTEDFDPFKENMDNLTKAAKQQQMAMGLASQAVSSLGSALEGMEDPGAKAAGMVMQSLASIALGFATASAQANTAGTGWGWLAWVAAGLAAMATAISTVHNLTGFAQGGIVDGNSYSGDNIPIMANAGEVVLTKAMQGNLASSLSENGLNSMNIAGRIKGTDIILAIDRSLKLEGKQLLTWGR